MKIAVVGAGISGLSCAWLLDKQYEITLFEQNTYLGGHSNTATINYSQQQIAVDTGFIVFNFRTYPNLKAFFELLDIAIEKSNMSFGIKHLDTGLEYSGNSLSALFAQKKNLFNPSFLRMLKDIVVFNKKAIQLIESEQEIQKQKTLDEFIADLKLGDYFKNHYLLPMAGAIWSCPLEQIKDYPAKTFLRFFYNHGLLTITQQPQWYTVQNGSQQYIKKIVNNLKGKVHSECAIVSAKQQGEKIILTDARNNQHIFDHVVFATHSDQTYKIIEDKTAEEANILGDIQYNVNTAVLHKDGTQMPDNKKAWASWVYLADKKNNQISLNYWMNQLQNIDPQKPLFVTLNPIKKIHQCDIFASYQYEHPVFDTKAIAAQEKLPSIQGKRNIWYCGAWTKYGFHEDGLNSAITVAKKLKVPIPWQTT